MANELATLSAAEKAIQVASTPEEAEAIENVAAAAIEFYKRQEDEGFENQLVAWRVFFKSAKKRTELIRGLVSKGQPKKGTDIRAFLSDFGFENNCGYRLYCFWLDVSPRLRSPTVTSMLRLIGELGGRAAAVWAASEPARDGSTEGKTTGCADRRRRGQRLRAVEGGVKREIVLQPPRRPRAGYSAGAGK